MKEKLKLEDIAVGPAPTNTVGSGNIAGVGVGTQGEPPGKKKKFIVLKRKKLN